MLVSAKHTGLKLGLSVALSLTTACSARQPTISEAKDVYLEASAPPVEGTKTRVAGALLGALVGAALGAALGAAGGGSSTAMATGVTAGVALGTGAGVAYAETVIKERQEYADASAYLTAYGLALDAQVKNARDFNDVLGNELTMVTVRGEDIDAAIRDAEEVRAKIDEQIGLQKQALEKARGENVDEGVASGQEARIVQLEAEETRLAAHIDRLSALRSSAPVETETRVRP